MNTWKTTILLLPILFMSCIAMAQTSRYEIGISAGAFIYRGDLTPSPFGSYRTPSLNMNLFIHRELNNAFTLRGQLALGRLRGDDASYTNPEWRQHRNFAFNASVTELSALLIWNKWGTEKRFSPYLFAGLGLGFTRIERDYSQLDQAYFAADHLQDRLAQDLEKAPPRTIAVLPLGAGLRYAINPKFSLLAETTLRLTRTDYLDGFSLSANPDLKDHYQSHTIGLVYRLGGNSGGGRGDVGCPVW